jgi:hypothetical protein
VSEVKLLGAHREAFSMIRMAEDNPLRAILCASNPLERLQLAINATKLPKEAFSTVVADILAQLSSGAREAAIEHLFETGVVGRLNAAIATQAGESYRELAVPPCFHEDLDASDTRVLAWSRVRDLLSQLNPDDLRSHLQANAVASLFERKQLQTADDADQAFAAFAHADRLLRAA